VSLCLRGAHDAGEAVHSSNTIRMYGPRAGRWTCFRATETLPPSAVWFRIDHERERLTPHWGVGFFLCHLRGATSRNWLEKLLLHLLRDYTELHTMPQVMHELHRTCYADPQPFAGNAGVPWCL